MELPHFLNSNYLEAQYQLSVYFGLRCAFSAPPDYIVVCIWTIWELSL